MAKLTRVHFSLLQHAYRSNKAELRLGQGSTISANWQQIIQSLELNDWLTHNTLQLSTHRQEELYQLCRDILHWDLNAQPEQLTRAEASAALGDDKLAGRSPNHDYMLVKPFTSGFPFTSCQAALPLPQHMALRCEVGALELSRLDAIIVVENLLAFDHFHQFKLPRLPSQSLVVYRGDQQYSPRALNRLLSLLSPQTQRIAFTDFDPAGFVIAHHLAAQGYGIFPQLSPELIAKANSPAKRLDFQKQYQQSQAIADKPEQLGGWLERWQQNQQMQTSISQELMFNLQVPLQIVAQSLTPS